ncbi:MAG: glycosyltransferase [Cycloclasticus sp.]
MSHDLIVFAEDWGKLPSSSQHLIGYLSRNRKVIWVNSIGLRKPNFTWRDLKRLCSKLSALKKPTTQLKATPSCHGFHIINPWTLPAPRSRLARKLASLILSAQLRPLIKSAQLEKPILWASLPTAGDVAKHLNISALVYYCGDDFSALAGVDHATVSQHESELVDAADLIMAASKKLESRFPSQKTYLLAHGVDFDLFTRDTPRANDLPNDGRPIAGFYGSISEWLDIALLKNVISQLPNWHFVFIGKPVVDISPLSQFPNVIFLGERSHQQLPSYSQHWTASLLPFKNNPQIQACNPLKLREYLAAGRPIISTPFPALVPYKNFIHPITTANEMVAELKLSALQGPNPKQRDSVAQQTWSARAQQVSSWLDNL